MSSLKGARTELAAAVAEAGYPVADHVPERITPPLVLMSTGDPYVTPAETFDTTGFAVHIELFAVAETGRNDTTTDQLDNMIERVLTYTGGWVVESVSAPFMAEHAGLQYLTARVSLGRLINIYNEGD